VTPRLPRKGYSLVELAVAVTLLVVVLGLPAMILRKVPAATDQLPSRTLSLEGGGSIELAQAQVADQ